MPSLSFLRFRVFLWVIAVVGCGRPSPPRSDQERFADDLHQYHRAVTQGWAYQESKRHAQGVDVTAIRDQLLSRIHEHTTREQFARLLQEFAAALQDGHSQVDTGRIRPSPQHTWPVGFVLVKEGVVVGNLNWLRDNPGIQLGDRLLRVDGQAIEEVLERQMVITSASTPLARRVLAVDQMHWTDAPRVRLAIQRPTGELVDREFPCLPGRVDFRYRERTEFCKYTRLEEGVGLLRIPQFSWNEARFSSAATDAERDAAIADAKDQIDEAFGAAEDDRGLILDLRGNSGGFELLSSYVAEHLVEGDFLYYTLTRHDTEFIRSLPAYQGLDPSNFGQPVPQHPRRWSGFRHFEGRRFSGRLIVLIDARCFSTTDNLCAFLQDVRPETRFVGTPTGAGTGEPMRIATLDHSGVDVTLCVSRIHSPQGRLIEGSGTLPDLQVEYASDDAVSGRDVVLDAAKSLLKNW